MHAMTNPIANPGQFAAEADVRAIRDDPRIAGVRDQIAKYFAIGYGDRLPEVQEIICETGLGLIFDFDNFHQSGDDPLVNWQALRPSVKAFHLKDSNSENTHVPFGTGAGRGREILSDALRTGWSIPTAHTTSR